MADPSVNPGDAPRLHKVARGEYLFKILRSYGLDETEAQVAMNLMAADPRGHGLTSGNVHVVYPGDTVRIPSASDVRRHMGTMASASSAAPASNTAIDPSGTAVPAVAPAAVAPAPATPAPPALSTSTVRLSPGLTGTTPARRATDVTEVRQALEDGSLTRLNELLDRFQHRHRPTAAGPGPAVPAIPPPAPRPPAAAATAFQLHQMASRLRQVAPREAVMRTTNRPAASSVLDQLARYGEPFTPQTLEDGFNVHRPYNAEAPELWMAYHSCPGCAEGSVRLCVLLKLLAIAEHWDALTDAFSLGEFEGFDTEV